MVYHSPLGNLGFSDNKFVLSVTHALFDGRYSMFLTEHLFDHSPALPPFPARDNLLADQLTNVPDIARPRTPHLKLTHIFSHDTKLEGRSPFVTFGCSGRARALGRKMARILRR
jgi:hypothetical protein